MSRQNIEDRGTWGDRLFNCSGFLGYPPGHLEIQADFAGNFTTILSRTNNKTDIGLIVRSADTVTSDCGAFDYLEFAFEASAMTLANHNKRLRCAIIPAIELQNETPVYDEASLKILSSMYSFNFKANKIMIHAVRSKNEKEMNIYKTYYCMSLNFSRIIKNT